MKIRSKLEITIIQQLSEVVLPFLYILVIVGMVNSIFPPPKSSCKKS